MFEQTEQMKDIYVIHTALTKGEHYQVHNSSFLDSRFFQKNPRSKQEALKLGKEPLGLSKIQQVRISHANISSIFRNKDSQTSAAPNFLKELAYEADLSFFDNKNLQHIIDF